MNGMEGNPYADVLDHATSTDALATLALAYEQRTANLIAFYGTVPTPKLGADTQKLRGQIIERLDLS